MTCTHNWTVTSECPKCLRAEIATLEADNVALRNDLHDATIMGAMRWAAERARKAERKRLP